MKQDINHWDETQTTAEMRNRCMYLMKELESWNIRPFRRERIKLQKTVKFTYNMKRLNHIHDKLESSLENAMMRKLSQGL
jgi:hypothetical protein